MIKMNNRGSGAGCPSDEQFPSRARAWLDSHRSAREAERLKNPDPEVEALFTELRESTEFLGLSRYSAGSVRDLHYIENPGSSVGGLGISDQEFLALFESGIETIDQLKRAIENGDITSPRLRSIGSGLK